MNLSSIVITKNEENNIADVINNLNFSSEIIVVDNQSTDNTVNIAKNKRAIVYSQKFSDYSAQRNFGLKKAHGEWILYVDADERVSDALKEDIVYTLNKKKRNNSYSGYYINRKNYYFGEREWPYIEKLERLFKKDMLIKWYGIIHESPEVDGAIGELSGYLEHRSHNNLNDMIKKTNKWSEVEADLIFKSNHPKMIWWRFIRIMYTKFHKSYINQSGYKVSAPGLIESIYQAFSYFIVYAKLWEKQESPNHSSNENQK